MSFLSVFDKISKKILLFKNIYMQFKKIDYSGECGRVHGCGWSWGLGVGWSRDNRVKGWVIGGDVRDKKETMLLN